jgi:small subunit ribosomal protein S6
MHYELIYILPGTLAETEVQTVTEKLKGMMTEMGASDMVVTEIGKNRLAYPMNHIRYGYFFITRFAAEQSAVEGIKEKLRLSGEVLRMMITVYDPKNPTEPKINYPTQTATAGKDLTMPELADAPVAIHAREEKKAVEKPVVSMEEIGEKLDEILDKDIVV